MKRSLRLAVVLLALALAPRTASAAFITFTESANGVDPVGVSTNLVLTAPIVATAQSATVVGFHHAGISPDPIIPGSRSAGLFAPGVPNLLSAYILLTAGDFELDAVFGLIQSIQIQFFTQDTLVSALPAAFPFGGGVVANGSFQDLSTQLAAAPEGLLVSVRAVPEPTSLLLLGSGALALAWRVRRRA